MDKARDPKFLKQRRMRRILMGIVGVLVVVAVSVAVSRLKPAPPSVDGSSIWPGEVSQGTMVRQVQGLGTLLPEDVRTIPAITEGRVEAIPILPGSPVKANTVLVELTNPVTVKALSDAKAQLAGAEADLANLKATLNTAVLAQQSTQANLVSQARQAELLSTSDQDLLKKGLVAKLDAETDAAKASALQQQVAIGTQQITSMQASDQAQIASSEAKVDQQRNAVALAETNVKGLDVISGIDGLLEGLDMGNGTQLQVGQWVTAGTAVAKVVQPNKLKAEIKIPETEVGDVAIGQPASIDTHNGIVPGHVERIDPNSINGTVAVDVALEGQLPPGARPDLSVNGVVNIQTLKDVVYVGRPAFGGPDQTVSMFKISADGKTGTRAQVQLGKASVNTIQILHGLGVGEWVVLSDTSAQDAFDTIRFSPPVAVH
ncbi:MAG: HlyD family secretion protein [Terriglobales bacterium]